MKRPTRRTVLRGAGVALALPWLESLAPRPSRGQSAAPPGPFVAMSFPLGTCDYWRPPAIGSGSAWELSPVLAPLAPVKPYVSVLANVGNYGPFGGHVEPSNANLNAALLTCTKARVSVVDGNGNNPLTTVGTSVDQAIAQAWRGQTKLDSLQVGLSTLDSYTDGLPAPCSRTISWRSPTDPTYKLVDPQAVFDLLVSSGATSAPVPADAPFAAARRAANKSVLDFALDHATTVRGRLGQADRVKMDDFLASVRALETRVATGVAGAACQVGARPAESYRVGMVPADYDRGVHADLMVDLVVMALQCDVTRVVSFMLDDARSQFPYDFLTERHFTATTSTPGTTRVAGSLVGLAESGTNNDGFATCNHWFVSQLANLCQKLAAVPTLEGSMLDVATIWFGSEMHGPNFDALDLPIVVVGKGGGRLKTDQFVDFGKTARATERLANLYLTFLRNVFGLPTSTFGVALGGPPPNGKVPPNAYGAGTDPIPEILT